MSSVTEIFFQSTILFFPGLIAAVCGFLAFRRHNSTKVTKLAQVAGAVLLIGVGLVGWSAGQANAFWLCSTAIGLVLIGQMMVNTRLASSLTMRSLSCLGSVASPYRWSLVLMGASPVLMACGLSQLNEITAIPDRVALDTKDFAAPDLEVDKSVYALTDLGSKIPLHKVRDGSEDSIAMDGDQGLPQDNTPLPYRAVRLTDPSGVTNCVGWVFADAQRWVLCRYVQQILDENGYQEIESPRTGDVAIYRDTHNEIIHVARVATLLSGGRPLIESKWGCQGVFLHLPEGTPYRATCHFYRTSRPNHVLTFTPQGEQGARSAAEALP